MKSGMIVVQSRRKSVKPENWLQPLIVIGKGFSGEFGRSRFLVEAQNSSGKKARKQFQIARRRRLSLPRPNSASIFVSRK
jgi:hypothetical protein